MTSLRSGRTWFGSHNFARDLSFIQSVLPGSHAMPQMPFAPAFFMRGTICRKLILTAHLSIVPPQRRSGGVTVLHSNRICYLIYCSTEKMWPATFPGYNSRRLSVSSDRHVETLCTSNFIHLRNINIASQRICVFHMIIRTTRKYFLIQQ